MSKILRLIQIEGHQNIAGLVLAMLSNGVVLGICVNEKCDYTAVMQPHQSVAHCAACGTDTVQSALTLAECSPSVTA